MVYFYVLLFVSGCIMGSFLVCQGERMAAGRDWIRGRSICDSCGHSLSGRDLIPVLSYLAGKGRCRYCGSKIPVSALLGELFCGYMYMRVFSVYGFSIRCLETLVLVSLLFSLSIVDGRTMEIPDGFIVCGCLVRLTGEVAEKGLQMRSIGGDVLGALAVPGVLLIVSLIMDRILGKESLGGGDIKLLFINHGSGTSVTE